MIVIFKLPIRCSHPYCSVTGSAYGCCMKILFDGISGQLPRCKGIFKKRETRNKPKIAFCVPGYFVDLEIFRTGYRCKMFRCCIILIQAFFGTNPKVSLLVFIEVINKVVTQA